MFISEAITTLNMTEDDLRMSLMGVRDDWDSCQEINDSEYQLISQSVGAAAALPPSDETTDSTEIQPVADMPIEKQETLLENASQILGHQMVLSVQRRVEMLNAVDKLVNQVVLTNREANQRQLAAQVAQRDEETKVELLRTINTLQGLVGTTNDVEVPQSFDDSDFHSAIANFQKKPQR